MGLKNNCAHTQYHRQHLRYLIVRNQNYSFYKNVFAYAKNFYSITSFKQRQQAVECRITKKIND